MTGASGLLLDTCALVWWTLDPAQLSPAAAAACREVEARGGHASAISVWEISIKARRGKLELGLPLADYVMRLRELSCLTLVPVDTAIWLRNVQLDWDHRDPADRTVVATAEVLGLSIVTADRVIADYFPRTVW